ncbi:MAG: hypothetical protein Q8P13_00935 [bacterium]|nr:hypothetical protein [bacterium]
MDIKSFVRKRKIQAVVVIIALVLGLGIVGLNTGLNTITETKTADLDENGMPAVNSEGTPLGPFEKIDNAPLRGATPTPTSTDD